MFVAEEIKKSVNNQYGNVDLVLHRYFIDDKITDMKTYREEF